MRRPPVIYILGCNPGTCFSEVWPTSVHDRLVLGCKAACLYMTVVASKLLLGNFGYKAEKGQLTAVRDFCHKAVYFRRPQFRLYVTVVAVKATAGQLRL